KMIWVRVTDLIANCSVDSNTALVTICNPAQIVSGLAQFEKHIASGSSITLSVSATGDNLTYVWTRSGRTAPLDATGPTLTDTPPAAPDGTVYVYTVSVQTAGGGSDACHANVQSSVHITIGVCSPMTLDLDLPTALVLP